MAECPAPDQLTAREHSPLCLSEGSIALEPLEQVLKYLLVEFCEFNMLCPVCALPVKGQKVMKGAPQFM